MKENFKHFMLPKFNLHLNSFLINFSSALNLGADLSCFEVSVNIFLLLNDEANKTG